MHRLAATLTGAVVGILCIEASLRLIWPQEDLHLYRIRDSGLLFHRANFDNLNAKNPYGAFLKLKKKFKPSLPIVNFFTGPVRTNSAGERDEREHTLAKPPGRFRVVGVGQCMSFGLDLPENKTFFRLLEERLPSVETINCSLHGASLAETRAVYEEACAGYEADLAIVPMVLQDLQASANRGRLVNADRRLIGYIYARVGRKIVELLERGEDGIVRLKPEARAQWLPSFRAYFEPRLPLYHQLHLVRFLENRWAGLNLFPGAEPELVPLVARLYGDDNPDQYPRTGLENQLQHLKHLKQVTASRNMKLLVLLLPESNTHFTKTYSEDAAWFREELSRNFDVLDLKEKMDPIRWSQLLVVNRIPSAAGHEWIADRISEELVAHYGVARKLETP